METIQVVLDAALLRAADNAAKRARMNRSALIRAALREHLRQLSNREREALDRQAYAECPDAFDGDWEKEASWPSE
jgi:metal-responsive CopG/Arc/MetJ family transcriptional regulator